MILIPKYTNKSLMMLGRVWFISENRCLDMLGRHGVGTFE